MSDSRLIALNQFREKLLSCSHVLKGIFKLVFGSQYSYS